MPERSTDSAIHLPHRTPVKFHRLQCNNGVFMPQKAQSTDRNMFHP